MIIVIYKIVTFIRQVFYQAICGIHFSLFKVSIGKNWKINGILFIRNSGTGGITIGKNFRANSGASNNPIGGDTILRLITKKEGKIIIGNNVGISNTTIFSENSILIEDGVLLGGGCLIWDTDFHSLDASIRGTSQDEGKTLPIVIKKKAFIGANSTLLKGVVIGENSIVATGSIVTKSIPDNQIWGGNPAKFIRDI
ncbi:DapH/DapD/GlmU-related protein [Aquimarina addita]|uniref:DapH/DapD/GlmU-related protein n=1 Tax=Aquimarina addita TaxID=870485 RepID=A0ABP7XAT1_9FLAO